MDNTPKLRVLVVDDHEEMRNMLRRVLEENDHIVHDAENGDVALKLLKQHPVDVMISDLVMPEKEGIETIMLVRKQYPGIRILAISGGHQSRMAMPYLDLAAKLGAHATLEKPFAIEDFLAKVKAILPPDFQGVSA